jgi:hypothetical protein
MPSRGIERPFGQEDKKPKGSGQNNERRRFFPIPPGTTEEEISELGAYLTEIRQLHRLCFWHYLDALNNFICQFGRKPTYEETLQILDDGHSAWFVVWNKIKENPHWDLNRQFQEQAYWYEKWKPWFEENNPSCFSGEEKSISSDSEKP